MSCQARLRSEDAPVGGPCFDRACKEVSARACWKRPKTPMKKYDNSSAGYGCVPRRVEHGGSTPCTIGSTEVTFCGKRGSGCAAIREQRAWMKSRCDPSRNRE